MREGEAQPLSGPTCPCYNSCVSQLKIVIVDYQAGNLRSVAKALERFGTAPVISGEPDDLLKADALVFPGQGSCDSAMKALRERRLVEPIKAFIQQGKPFLGVCLGLQLLLERSEEGEEPGLGLYSGTVKRLPPGLKVPHMGWNQVDLHLEHPVLRGIPSGSYFYFVHSFYADPKDRSLVAGTTCYGFPFCSAIADGNLVATQFHPEKSGAMGLKLYENFVSFAGGQQGADSWR